MKLYRVPSLRATRKLVAPHQVPTYLPVGLLPAQLADLVDLFDPDMDYIVGAVDSLREAGLDTTDPAVFQMAIDLGHKRATEALDDCALQPEAKPKPEIKLALSERQVWEHARASVLAGHGRDPVVYYMRTGNRCKIGYSGNVIERFSRLTAEELLAVEPGGRHLEGKRHRQFASLRTRGEWFCYEDALVEHVHRIQLQMQGQGQAA